MTPYSDRDLGQHIGSGNGLLHRAITGDNIDITEVLRVIPHDTSTKNHRC